MPIDAEIKSTSSIEMPKSSVENGGVEFDLSELEHETQQAVDKFIAEFLGPGAELVENTPTELEQIKREAEQLKTNFLERLGYLLLGSGVTADRWREYSRATIENWLPAPDQPKLIKFLRDKLKEIDSRLDAEEETARKVGINYNEAKKVVADEAFAGLEDLVIYYNRANKKDQSKWYAVARSAEGLLERRLSFLLDKGDIAAAMELWKLFSDGHADDGKKIVNVVVNRWHNENEAEVTAKFGQYRDADERYRQMRPYRDSVMAEKFKDYPDLWALYIFDSNVGYGHSPEPRTASVLLDALNGLRGRSDREQVVARLSVGKAGLPPAALADKPRAREMLAQAYLHYAGGRLLDNAAVFQDELEKIDLEERKEWLKKLFEPDRYGDRNQYDHSRRYELTTAHSGDPIARLLSHVRVTASEYEQILGYLNGKKDRELVEEELRAGNRSLGVLPQLTNPHLFGVKDAAEERRLLERSMADAVLEGAYSGDRVAGWDVIVQLLDHSEKYPHLTPEFVRMQLVAWLKRKEDNAVERNDPRQARAVVHLLDQSVDKKYIDDVQKNELISKMAERMNDNRLNWPNWVGDLRDVWIGAGLLNQIVNRMASDPERMGRHEASRIFELFIAGAVNLMGVNLAAVLEKMRDEDTWNHEAARKRKEAARQEWLRRCQTEGYLQSADFIETMRGLAEAPSDNRRGIDYEVQVLLNDNNAEEAEKKRRAEALLSTLTVAELSYGIKERALQSQPKIEQLAAEKVLREGSAAEASACLEYIDNDKISADKASVVTALEKMVDDRGRTISVPKIIDVHIFFNSYYGASMITLAEQNARLEVVLERAFEKDNAGILEYYGQRHLPRRAPADPPSPWEERLKDYALRKQNATLAVVFVERETTTQEYDGLVLNRDRALAGSAIPYVDILLEKGGGEQLQSFLGVAQRQNRYGGYLISGSQEAQAVYGQNFGPRLLAAVLERGTVSAIIAIITASDWAKKCDLVLDSEALERAATAVGERGSTEEIVQFIADTDSKKIYDWTANRQLFEQLRAAAVARAPADVAGAKLLSHLVLAVPRLLTDPQWEEIILFAIERDPQTACRNINIFKLDSGVSARLMEKFILADPIKITNDFGADSVLTPEQNNMLIAALAGGNSIAVIGNIDKFVLASGENALAADDRVGKLVVTPEQWNGLFLSVAKAYSASVVAIIDKMPPLTPVQHDFLVTEITDKDPLMAIAHIDKLFLTRPQRDALFLSALEIDSITVANNSDHFPDLTPVQKDLLVEKVVVHRNIFGMVDDIDRLALSPIQRDAIFSRLMVIDPVKALDAFDSVAAVSAEERVVGASRCFESAVANKNWAALVAMRPRTKEFEKRYAEFVAAQKENHESAEAIEALKGLCLAGDTTLQNELIEALTAAVGRKPGIGAKENGQGLSPWERAAARILTVVNIPTVSRALFELSLSALSPDDLREEIFVALIDQRRSFFSGSVREILIKWHKQASPMRAWQDLSFVAAIESIPSAYLRQQARGSITAGLSQFGPDQSGAGIHAEWDKEYSFIPASVFLPVVAFCAGDRVLIAKFNTFFQATAKSESEQNQLKQTIIRGLELDDALSPVARTVFEHADAGNRDSIGQAVDIVNSLVFLNSLKKSLQIEIDLSTIDWSPASSLPEIKLGLKRLKDNLLSEVLPHPEMNGEQLGRVEEFWGGDIEPITTYLGRYPNARAYIAELVSHMDSRARWQQWRYDTGTETTRGQVGYLSEDQLAVWRADQAVELGDLALAESGVDQPTHIRGLITAAVLEHRHLSNPEAGFKEHAFVQKAVEKVLAEATKEGTDTRSVIMDGIEALHADSVALNTVIRAQGVAKARNFRATLFKNAEVAVNSKNESMLKEIGKLLEKDLRIKLQDAFDTAKKSGQKTIKFEPDDLTKIDGELSAVEAAIAAIDYAALCTRLDLPNESKNPKPFIERRNDLQDVGDILRLCVLSVRQIATNDLEDKPGKKTGRSLTRLLDDLKKHFADSPLLQDLSNVEFNLKEQRQLGAKRRLALLFTDNPKVMWQVGKYPLGSGSCQNYASGSYAQALLGYVGDAHCKAAYIVDINSLPLEEIARINIAENIGEAILVTPPQLLLEASVARSVFKLGRAGDKPAIFMEPTYTVINKGDNSMDNYYNLFARIFVAEPMGAVAARGAGTDIISISTSRNPAGQYEDGALGGAAHGGMGIQRGAYELGARFIESGKKQTPEQVAVEERMRESVFVE